MTSLIQKRIIILSKVSFISFAFLSFIFCACAVPPIEYQQGTVVAVWDLENLSPLKSSHPDLRTFLSDRVAATIKDKGIYDIVERQKLLLVLDELNLGTSMLVDETTRLKLGRIVGARLMVFGGYMVFTERMHLSLRLVDIETGGIVKTAEKTVLATELAGWLKAAEDGANELFLNLLIR